MRKACSPRFGLYLSPEKSGESRISTPPEQQKASIFDTHEQYTLKGQIQAKLDQVTHDAQEQIKATKESMKLTPVEVKAQAIKEEFLTLLEGQLAGLQLTAGKALGDVISPAKIAHTMANLRSTLNSMKGEDYAYDSLQGPTVQSPIEKQLDKRKLEQAILDALLPKLTTINFGIQETVLAKDSTFTKNRAALVQWLRDGMKSELKFDQASDALQQPTQQKESRDRELTHLQTLLAAAERAPLKTVPSLTVEQATAAIRAAGAGDIIADAVFGPIDYQSVLKNPGEVGVRVQRAPDLKDLLVGGKADFILGPDKKTVVGLRTGTHTAMFRRAPGSTYKEVPMDKQTIASFREELKDPKKTEGYMRALGAYIGVESASNPPKIILNYAANLKAPAQAPNTTQEQPATKPLDLNKPLDQLLNPKELAYFEESVLPTYKEVNGVWQIDQVNDFITKKFGITLKKGDDVNPDFIKIRQRLLALQ